MKYIYTVLVASLFVPALAFASVGITLQGGEVRVQQNRSFVEPGYSAVSTVDGDITGSVLVSSVDTHTVGDSTVTYNVTDSALSVASATRSVTVFGTGGAMPYCSGPLAPGWNTGMQGGGCGNTSTYLAAGTNATVNGIEYSCPLWMGNAGCVIK